eukprot:758228-Ditylum_brightwellii.AAC.1
MGKATFDKNDFVFWFAEQPSQLTIKYRVGSNLPLGYLECGGVEATAHPGAAIESGVDDRNIGLTHNEKILLCWYFKLDHFFLGWIQFLMQRGKDGEPPVGKGVQQGSGANHLVEVDPGALYADDLVPGQKVLVDQYVSKVKGRLVHTCGKEKPTDMYNGSAMFVDHATKLTYVANQTLLIAADTVMTKQYHGDNRVFMLHLWVQHCEAMNQLPTSMGGVGAHHQNAVAEQAIGRVAQSARTMLLHAAIYWPDITNLMMWPFALDYVVDIWNNMPDMDTGLSPMEKFGASRVNHTDLFNFHVWGCPTYVLDPKLQGGKKLLNDWNPRFDSPMPDLGSEWLTDAE